MPLLRNNNVKKLGELLEKLSSFLYYTESTFIESKPAAKYISALL
jgi:hypothetical protein